MYKMSEVTENLRMFHEGKKKRERDESGIGSLSNKTDELMSEKKEMTDMFNEYFSIMFSPTSNNSKHRECN